MLLLQVDASLSFLDDYVSEALERGATPYKPAHMRKAERPQEEAEESKYPERVDCGYEFKKIRELLGYGIIPNSQLCIRICNGRLFVPAAAAPAASEIKITPYERPSLQPVYHVPPSMTSYTENTLSSTPPSSNMLNDVGFGREQTTHPLQDDNTYQLSS